MITIRNAEEEDTPAMVMLLQHLFSLETDFTPSPEKQQRGLLLLINHPVAKVLVAEVEDRVVGMCSVQQRISTAAGKKVGLLEDVIVAPQHRGQGIGSALLQAAEDWTREQGLAHLQLQADCLNKPALSFYNKQGWKTTQLIGLWKKPSAPLNACS